MYFKNRVIPVIALSAAVSFFSCTKKLNTNLDNTNGLSIQTLKGKDIFPAAALATVTNKVGTNLSTASDNYDHTECWMGYWCRNSGWAQSGSQTYIETLQLPNSYSNGIWQSLYHNIYDYNFIVSHSLPNSVLTGAARVLRTMVFQDLVDQFGNIPYTQAGQAPAILTPKYDDQKAIYKDLILQLDTAITSLQASQATTDDAVDIVFHGDKNLWTKFANTLKLRILLRQVPNGDQSYVTTELGNIVSQGSGFLGAGQDVLINPGFKDASSQQSPFWGDYGFQPGSTTAAYQNNSFFCANNFILKFLQARNDIRYKFFYGPSSASTYQGNDLASTFTPSSNTSPIGPGLLQSPTMPALLFSASQSFFMQAEAVQRGLLTTGDLTTLFKQGVEESFRYLGVPNAISAADNFIASSGDVLININAPGANKLQTILYQKWVAENGSDGYEAWSDFRRTGYPTNTVAVLGLGPIPKRLLYPQSEYIQNPINVGAQNQTPGDIMTPVFWGN